MRPFKRSSIVACARLVAAHYQLPLAVIMSRSRQRSHAWPRQEAMWLAHALTGASYVSIATVFSRHHTSAMHAVRCVNRRASQDIDTAQRLADFVEQAGADGWRVAA